METIGARERMSRTVTIPTARIGKAIAAFTMGIVKSEVPAKVEDAMKSAGPEIPEADCGYF